MQKTGINKPMIRKGVSFIVLLAFLLNSGIAPIPYALAQETLQLPQPGARIDLSPAFAPPLLKGVKVYPDNPFKLDFILDKGDSSTSTEDLKSDSTRLIKYFLASITVPERDLWVNLSPYEKDRIVPDAFGVTEMGRDLLAQDYMLKQITASLIYPEGSIGKEFWSRIYTEAQKRFGTTDLPVDTFNKVWIVPAKAVVYENGDSAYVVESYLKVLLEEDYLALEKGSLDKVVTGEAKETNKLGAEIVREVVIPILEKEVNEGKNFAQLRQVYHSLILALWFKDKIRESILGQAYVDKDKVAGVDIADKAAKEKIWAQYVEAFKKGAYNYIKEETDPVTQQTVPRKYFSGGAGLFLTSGVLSRIHNREKLPQGISGRAMIVVADMAMKEEVSRPEERLTQSEDVFLTPLCKSVHDFLEGNEGRQWREAHQDAFVIYAVRHQESIMNVRQRGTRFDNFEPGTPHGRKQAQAFLEFFTPIKFDYFVSSDSERAYTTLLPLWKRQGHEGQMPYDERLSEVSFFPVGALPQNMVIKAFDPEDLFSKYPDLFMNVHLESMTEYVKGLRDFFNEWAGRSEILQGKNMIVATHGYSMFVQMALLGDIPIKKIEAVKKKILGDDKVFPNVGVNVIAYLPKEKRWQVLVLKDNDYLPKELQNGSNEYEKVLAEFYAKYQVVIRRAKDLLTSGKAHPVHRDYYPQAGPQWKWNLRKPTSEQVERFKRDLIAKKTGVLRQLETRLKERYAEPINIDVPELEAIDLKNQEHIRNAQRNLKSFEDRTHDLERSSMEARLRACIVLRNHVTPTNEKKDFVDYHVHTFRSSGYVSPSYVIYEAWKTGMKEISVTDHNTMAHFEETLRAAAIFGIKVIPGVEVSTAFEYKMEGVSYNVDDAHFLVYFPDVKETNLAEFLQQFKTIGLYEEINKRLTWDRVTTEFIRQRLNMSNEQKGKSEKLSFSNFWNNVIISGPYGRHVAEMWEKLYASQGRGGQDVYEGKVSIQGVEQSVNIRDKRQIIEALEGVQKPYGLEIEDITKALEDLQKNGFVSTVILAHPYASYMIGDVQNYLPRDERRREIFNDESKGISEKAIRAILDQFLVVNGLEVFYPNHPAKWVSMYEGIAKDMRKTRPNFVISLGSDTHYDGVTGLGLGKNNNLVDYQKVKDLDPVGIPHKADASSPDALDSFDLAMSTDKEGVLNQWGIGSIEEIKFIKNGRWFVTTRSGKRYVLKDLGLDMKPKDKKLPWELSPWDVEQLVYAVDLQNHLSKKLNGLVPSFLSKEGTSGDKPEDFYVQDGDGFYTLESVVAGIEKSVLDAEPGVLMEIGSALARFHDVTAEYIPEGKESQEGWPEYLYRQENRDVIFDVVRSQYPESYDFIQHVIQQFLDNAPVGLYRSLPSAIIHGDTNISNFLFDEKGYVSGVIDLLDAGRTPRIVDFTSILFKAREPGKNAYYDRNNVEELIKGYQSSAKQSLSKAELQALPYFLFLEPLSFFMRLHYFGQSTYSNDLFKRVVEYMKDVRKDIDRGFYQGIVDKYSGMAIDMASKSIDTDHYKGMDKLEGVARKQPIKLVQDIIYPDAVVDPKLQGEDRQAKGVIVDAGHGRLKFVGWENRRSDDFTDEEKLRMEHPDPIEEFQALQYEDIASIRQTIYDRSSGIFDISAIVEDKKGQKHYFRVKSGNTTSLGLRELIPSIQKMKAPGAFLQASMGNQGDLVGNFTVVSKGNGWEIFGAANEDRFSKSYRSLIQYKDGSKKLSLIKLEPGEGGVSVYSSDNGVRIRLMPDEIDFIMVAHALVWGDEDQHKLLKETYVAQYDLRHIFRLPTNSDQIQLFYGQISRSPENLSAALNARKIILDAQDPALGDGDIRALLNSVGYHQADSWDQVLAPGDYYVEGDKIAMIFLPARYPMNAMLVGREGQVGFVEVPGASGRKGVNYFTAGAWILAQAKENFDWEPQAVFVLDNGMDPTLIAYVDNKEEFLAKGPRTGFNASLSVVDQAQDLGGIDLTPDKMQVQVRSAGSGVQFNFDPAMIEQLQNASGLTPVIIDIQPMKVTVPMFLGLADKEETAEALSIF